MQTKRLEKAVTSRNWTGRRIPRHIGVIPDGNRRWAVGRGLPKEAGYQYGLAPAEDLIDACTEIGIHEITFYGFTQDNTKRSRVQRRAFQAACVEAASRLDHEHTDLHVIGNVHSPMFPVELLPYTRRPERLTGRVRVNLLVNYSWQWDFGEAVHEAATPSKNSPMWPQIGSSAVSTIDVILRWGGRNRLSGFLPIQSAYADLFIIEALWPDYHRTHLEAALDWYQTQDVTLGG